MSIFDNRLFTWLQPRPVATSSPPARRPISARALAGGRVSRDSSTFFYTVASPEVNQAWRMTEFDPDNLKYMSPADLLDLLSTASPEIAAGLWNALRLCNPGWKAEALRPGSDEQDERAQAALNDFLGHIAYVYAADTTPADVVINSLFMAAFMRGAFMAELVLDRNGRLPLNLAAPDPISARFRQVNHPELGKVWQLGQWQEASFVPLDRETVAYVPVDPLPGTPYGRSLISPSVFSAVFLINILHDVRRVIMQQGWPRIDISIVLEKLLNAMPASGVEAERDWIQGVVDEVTTLYASLEPDDAYVHLDIVEINRPVGTVDASSLSAVDGLINALERMIARGCKMMPLMLGIDDATSDANANRQWEIQAAGIKALQHLCEQMLERLLGLALQAQGIQARVKFRFAELRAAEMLRDAQTEAMNIANANAKYQAGWISQDEASQQITGKPADLPAPRATAGAPAIIRDDGDGNERLLLREIRAARQAVEQALEPVASANGHGEMV